MTNPATGEVTGQVALASVEDARAVIDAAAAAFPAWRDTSLAKRTQILFTFRELLNERKGELAEIITAEHGKVVSDALGEVSRGQEVVEFACGIPHLLKGGFTENASTKVDVYSIRQPLGSVGVISPFNFPAMVPMWFFPIAIATGNTVVLKPSEKDPSASLWMAKLWAEAGLPAGVFNVLQGDKTAVDELLTNPKVKSVSLRRAPPRSRSTSTPPAPPHGKRVQALGGAKNHAVILPDADLDLAADAMVNAGFGSAGERCMAISAVRGGRPDRRRPGRQDRRARRHHSRSATAPRTPTWARWSPRPTATRWPPTSTPARPTAPRSSSTAATCRPTAAQNGFWLGPTLIDHVTPEMSVYTDEIFGPVLSVVRVETYDEALESDQLQPLRQRHRDLHQRRRRRPALPERGPGRHDRHQRAHPGTDGLLQLRRLESLAVRRQPRPRHGRRAVLHPRQGHHPPLARPQPRRHRTRLPPEQVSGDTDMTNLDERTDNAVLPNGRTSTTPVPRRPERTNSTAPTYSTPGPLRRRSRR